MKPESFLVSISRMEVFVESDLFDILSKNQISAAAFDCWPNNPVNGNKIMPSDNFKFHAYF